MQVGEIDPRCVSPTNQPPTLTPQQAEAHTWTPDSETWAAIKSRSSGRAATVTIAGPASRGHVTIQISKDPVALRFSTDVPLMPRRPKASSNPLLKK
jgi:hypothetical protein